MAELSKDVSARVDACVAAGDLAGAATLLMAAGDPRRASQLFERACQFAQATEAALAGSAYGEALRLAVLAGEKALIQTVSDALLEHAAPERVRSVARSLADRGDHLHAAPLLEKLGDGAAAGDAYARGGRSRAAATAYDDAGLPAKAARVLEAALRAGAEADGDALRAQLGELYARHGKHRAAVRVLQLVPETSTARRDVLGVLASSLEALGLGQARRDLEAELARHRISARPSQSEQEDRAEAVLFGRYQVIREVATTPHARLVEAKDRLNGERVAVKVLSSRTQGTGRDALARFVREARALQQLRHPNVVPLRGFLEEGPAMILAWMGGGSLRGLLDRELISPARAAEISRAVLDALAEAHRLGILHRDIKPSNLLFDDGGAARLADFGAAHMAESEATVTVGAIGTVAYMSPEQRAGRSASVQSDLYGVGVLLYEMLSGELPGTERPLSVQSFHPDLEDGHDAIVNRLLAQAPADRYPSALDARRAIERTTWATRLGTRSIARGEPTHDVQVADAAHRVVPPKRGGDRHDVWTGRDVHVLSLADHREHAAAFARADHPALATVLRADSKRDVVWVETMSGRPLSQGLSLSEPQRDALRDGLAALHRAGGHHGQVDSEHVFVHAGAARLAYPAERRGVEEPAALNVVQDADREALARLR